MASGHCEPRNQAEHMAAPTNPATWWFFLPTRSRPHMARLGPPGTSAFPPLVGAKRTSVGEYERSRLMSTRPGFCHPQAKSRPFFQTGRG